MLLDTCAILWLACDQCRLSQMVLKQIDEANIVYISAISGFEIGIKYKSGKLKLPVSPMEWLSSIVMHHHLTVLDLDLETCVKATTLPFIHKDPCDRLIIAAALVHNMQVVTLDEIFIEYGVRVLQ